VVNWTWTFDAGSGVKTLFGESISYNFSIPGNYTITLTVRDEANNSEDDSLIVNVAKIPGIEPGGIGSEDNDDGFPIWIIFVIISVLLLLLIGAGIGVFLFMKNKGEPESPQDISDTQPEDPDPSVNNNIDVPIQ